MANRQASPADFADAAGYIDQQLDAYLGQKPAQTDVHLAGCKHLLALVIVQQRAQATGFTEAEALLSLLTEALSEATSGASDTTQIVADAAFGVSEKYQRKDVQVRIGRLKDDYYIGKDTYWYHRGKVVAQVKTWLVIREKAARSGTAEDEIQSSLGIVGGLAWTAFYYLLTLVMLREDGFTTDSVIDPVDHTPATDVAQVLFIKYLEIIAKMHYGHDWLTESSKIELSSYAHEWNDVLEPLLRHTLLCAFTPEDLSRLRSKATADVLDDYGAFEDNVLSDKRFIRRVRMAEEHLYGVSGFPEDIGGRLAEAFPYSGEPKRGRLHAFVTTFLLSLFVGVPPKHRPRLPGASLTVLRLLDSIEEVRAGVVRMDTSLKVVRALYFLGLVESILPEKVPAIAKLTNQELDAVMAELDEGSFNDALGDSSLPDAVLPIALRYRDSCIRPYDAE